MLVTLVLVLLLALSLVALVLTGPVAEAVGSAVGIGDTAVRSGTSPSGRCCSWS